MRPLILILLTSLAAISVQAQTQTIADIARRERARKAQTPSKSTWVIKTEDIRTAPPAEADEPAAAPEGAAVPSSADEAAAPDTPAAADPSQQWYDETALIRAKVRELTDQETAAQLLINNLMNQVFAPQSSQTARDQAQSELQAAQQRLQGVRTDLEKIRGELQARELQGPPKK